VKQLHELTIMTPNKPGTLAKVLRSLSQAKINILALDSSSGYDLNLVRLITSDSTKTKRVLEKLGHTVTQTAVLGITIMDRPGQLAKIASCCGKMGVNIDYIYATAAAGDQEALVVLHLSDFEKAKQALKMAGLI
jgi:hypothetical protein